MQWSWPTVLWYFPNRQRLQLVTPPPTGEYWTSFGDEYLAIAHPWQIRFVVTFGEFLTNLPAAHFNIKAHDAFPPFPHCQYPIGHVEQELLEPAVDLYLPNTHFAQSILLWFWKSKKDIDKNRRKKTVTSVTSAISSNQKGSVSCSTTVCNRKRKMQQKNSQPAGQLLQAPTPPFFIAAAPYHG